MPVFECARAGPSPYPFLGGLSCSEIAPPSHPKTLPGERSQKVSADRFIIHTAVLQDVPAFTDRQVKNLSFPPGKLSNETYNLGQTPGNDVLGIAGASRMADRSYL